MKETLENMANKPEKKRKKFGKYDVIILLNPSLGKGESK